MPILVIPDHKIVELHHFLTRANRQNNYFITTHCNHFFVLNMSS